MKPTNPSEPDGALRAHLRSWNIEVSVPARFQENVWQRIARRENAAELGAWGRFQLWLERLMSRPSAAVGYLGLLLLLGLTTGYWQAHGTIAQTENDLRHRYVQTVDPYQRHRP